MLLVSIWLNNTSLLVPKSKKRPLLLAHRGLGQTFDIEGVKWNTNTAKIIHEPEHPYLENTIEGIAASIQNGADLVEFDVRLTKDNQLAVFHDFLLEYRTDGKGLLSEHTMEELRRLDIGYGYTADGGVTYPFRGKGAGKLPSVDEVLKTFPETNWLIHIKDGGVEAAKVLESHLLELNGAWQKRIAIYGNKAAVLYFRDKYPKIKTLTKSIMMNALVLYALVGWTGYIPKAMHSLEMHMPLNYARLLWGWPHRFLRRMERVNSRFVLVNGSGGFSSGFDDVKSLDQLPKKYTGCIWTDRIDILGPYFLKTKM
ncbi:MAG: glycerophosphodiester phosphodiesterase family protein [Chitinispirillia bacterium]